MIYGHDLVLVDKEPDKIRWLVRSEQGRELIAVPWRLVYDQSEIEVSSKGPRRYRFDQDKLQALETCILVAPLTDPEVWELLRKYPNLSGKRSWVVDPANMAWVPTRPFSSRQTNTDSALPPVRSTPEPRPVEEVVVADPERKLLF